jgi:hypothetical protein
MLEPSPLAHPAYRIDYQEVGMAEPTPAKSIDRRGLLLPLVSVSQLEARSLIAMKPNAVGHCDSGESPLLRSFKRP